MRRDGGLSVRQVQVFQWISDDCPDGMWRDFTYKTTAYALAARGLVKVDRRRKQWSATITEEGEFYLSRGRYPEEAAAAGGGGPSAETHSDADVLAAKLLTSLMSRDEKLVVPSPSEPRRAQYRRSMPCGTPMCLSDSLRA
jgi:hypothetical protein